MESNRQQKQQTAWISVWILQAYCKQQGNPGWFLKRKQGGKPGAMNDGNGVVVEKPPVYDEPLVLTNDDPKDDDVNLKALLLTKTTAQIDVTVVLATVRRLAVETPA